MFSSEARVIVGLWRDDSKPITHGLTYAVSFLRRYCAHVTKGVPQMHERTKQLEQLPISNDIVEAILPCFFHHANKLRQSHESRFIARTKRHPTLDLFRLF